MLQQLQRSLSNQLFLVVVLLVVCVCVCFFLVV